jgi:drug/metabolite transporter (DMT)-like permease
MPPTQRHWRDWGMLLMLTVMWGSAFLLTKVAVTAMPPTWVVSGRLLIGAVVLVLLLVLLQRRPPRGRRAWTFFVLIAIVGNAMPFFLISWGQQAIDSGQAGVLMAIMPLVTMILAHFFLPDEPLSKSRVAGFAMGFGGIVVLMGPGSLLALGTFDETLLAKLAVLGGAFCYAVSAILSRLRPDGDAVVTAAVTTTVAALITLPWYVGGPDRAVTLGQVEPTAWLALVLLGLFSTALAAVVYFRLVKQAGPSFVALLNYLIPLWAVAVGAMFLGEALYPAQLIALTLVLAGVFLSQRKGAKPWAGRHDDTAPSLPVETHQSATVPVRVDVARSRRGEG